MQEKILKHDFYVKLTFVLNRFVADISNAFLIAMYSLLNNKAVQSGFLVTEKSSLFHRPQNRKKLKVVTTKEDGDVRAFLPSRKKGIYIEIPKKIVERAPFFLEI